MSKNSGDVWSQQRDVDPAVLPLFDQLIEVTDALHKCPSRQNPELEDRLQELWRKFRDLVAEGKRIHPQTAVTLELRLLSLERFDEAEFMTRHLLTLQPRSIESLCFYGSTLVRSGRYRVAEEVYEQAIDSCRAILKDKNVDLDQLLSDSSDAGGQRGMILRAMFLDTGDVYERLARVQILQGKLEEGATSAQRAQKLHLIGELPKSEPWRLWGEVQLRLGNVEESRTALRNALLINTSQEGDFGEPERIMKIIEVLDDDVAGAVALLDRLDEQERRA